jgi:hypothetical protein
MDCFIKKIFIRRTDESIHRQFVRFGKGTFPGRAALNLVRGEKIKLRGSFEYANDFVSLVSELGDAKFLGIILSKEELQGLTPKKKSAVLTYEVTGLSSGKIKEIAGKAYTMLLDAEGPGLSLKMKKKLPKPGKSGEAKIDDKFCILEADAKFWNQIKEAFMFPECKKAKVKHTYIIDEIEMPKGEKDFEKIRLLSKRKGKLVRKTEIDGKEGIKEIEFEA